MWWKIVISVIIGYLMGNINFAVIITRLNKKNIKEMGSGNPGTMNMLRNMGAKWGALTLIGDAAKSAIPSLIGNALVGPIGMYAAGLASVVEHVYPVSMGFKGGKGVACAIGFFLVASPITALITFAGIVVFLLITQYGSLASLLFVTVLTVEQGVIYGGAPANVAIIIMLFAIWALVWFCHRTNIVRAVLGKEHRSNLMNSFKKIKTTKDGENEKN